MYLYLCMHVSSRRAYHFSQMHMCKMHVSVCIMYVSCMYVFFCMYLVCIMYVQVYVCMACIGPIKYQALTTITWRNDLLQGPQHAGPTQGRDEQVPIYFVPPSKTTCHIRFGALPRAARVERVQLGFRVSPTGLPCALIHW